jgi:hypothetical protein
MLIVVVAMPATTPMGRLNKVRMNNIVEDNNEMAHKWAAVIAGDHP